MDEISDKVCQTVAAVTHTDPGSGYTGGPGYTIAPATQGLSVSTVTIKNPDTGCETITLLKVLAIVATVFVATGSQVMAADWDCRPFGKLSVCPVPKAPAPPPKCSVFDDQLICSGEVDAKHLPSNCGFRHGKYICW